MENPAYELVVELSNINELDFGKYFDKWKITMETCHDFEKVNTYLAGCTSCISVCLRGLMILYGFGYWQHNNASIMAMNEFDRAITMGSTLGYTCNGLAFWKISEGDFQNEQYNIYISRISKMLRLLEHGIRKGDNFASRIYVTMIPALLHDYTRNTNNNKNIPKPEFRELTALSFGVRDNVSINVMIKKLLKMIALGESMELTGFNVIPSLSSLVFDCIDRNECKRDILQELFMKSVKYYTKKKLLRTILKENKRLQQEIRMLNEHIQYMPNGTGYFDAQKEFNKLRDNSK